MTYTYKIATSQDIDIIVALADQTWKQTYKGIISDEQIEYMYSNMYTPEALRKQQQEGNTFIIVYENDIPLGFSSFSKTDENIYKIHKLYVLPLTQGKGIGRFLIDSVISEIKPKGAEILELNVNRYNKAKQFYDKLGFKVHEEVDIPYGKFVLNDYVMRMKLV
ncbi:GNAT family N-acetyltransferase [Solitalea sp. MAHUQ-68]|uniref:GNAT family N-acetyltransferase n=1 Tax=Solitalea agri TaxID=2953739 RepID=A0A9X2JCC5_9SPHI|nr:GNAT family N-acetyltransferase [Solitalea agri]MCO4293362.1 GNAT family N-acetyltransferase [Solitalea agri]